MRLRACACLSCSAERGFWANFLLRLNPVSQQRLTIRKLEALADKQEPQAFLLKDFLAGLPGSGHHRALSATAGRLYVSAGQSLTATSAYGRSATRAWQGAPNASRPSLLVQEAAPKVPEAQLTAGARCNFSANGASLGCAAGLPAALSGRELAIEIIGLLS